ncbi:unnamed protein product [Rangifer tarandus platyrhynchus]|uniref:Uncharacterized protein n=1 Tax=Rangifer tarandus platyrhynchus TaxID=3082113 RepID=A0AC60A9N0_RANTA
MLEAPLCKPGQPAALGGDRGPGHGASGGVPTGEISVTCAYYRLNSLGSPLGHGNRNLCGHGLQVQPGHGLMAAGLGAELAPPQPSSCALLTVMRRLLGWALLATLRALSLSILGFRGPGWALVPFQNEFVFLTLAEVPLLSPALGSRKARSVNSNSSWKQQGPASRQEWAHCLMFPEPSGCFLRCSA